jgi:hypothetical protein
VGVVRRSCLLLVAVSLLTARHLPAADFLHDARRLQLASSGDRQTFLWVARSPVVLPAADPRAVGATLEVANPVTGERATLLLPPPGWRTNGPGTLYRFRGADGGDVRAATLSGRGLLRVVARTTGITLDEPSQTVLAVVLAVGEDRYCSTCRTPVADGPGRFLATSCPPEPCRGAASSTSTTTTTTLPSSASCRLLPQPPGSCTADGECPAGYACRDGACTGPACTGRADCPAEGECVFAAEPDTGTCVCRGCGTQECPIGCREGFFFSGCICTSLRDCPPEDDVCFRGVCN